MLEDKRIVAIFPKYSAVARLTKMVRDLPPGVVDEIVVSSDENGQDWEALAKRLGLSHFVRRAENVGPGDHQKFCYKKALELGADVVIQIGPGYRFNLALVPAMVTLVTCGQYDLVLGSRVLSHGTIRDGMTRRRLLANRVCTLIQNRLMGQRLSEFHSGYRVFSRRLLAQLPLGENSSQQVFDNQVITQAAFFGFAIGEITAPSPRWPEPGLTNFGADARYAVESLWTSLRFRLQKCRLRKYAFLNPEGRRITPTQTPSSITRQDGCRSKRPASPPDGEGASVVSGTSFYQQRGVIAVHKPGHPCSSEYPA